MGGENMQGIVDISPGRNKHFFTALPTQSWGEESTFQKMGVGPTRTAVPGCVLLGTLFTSPNYLSSFIDLLAWPRVRKNRRSEFLCKVLFCGRL